MSLASNTTLPALFRFYTLADLQASYATSLMASVSYGSSPDFYEWNVN
jgi:hypothetical protein